MSKKKCKWCGSLGHTQFYCKQKRYDYRKRNTPVNKFGKYAKQWVQTREQWFKLNPPDAIGAYWCYLCGRHLYPNQVTLDHIKSRSRHPELRFVLSNLAPLLGCNTDKGTKDL